MSKFKGFLVGKHVTLNTVHYAITAHAVSCICHAVDITIISVLIIWWRIIENVQCADVMDTFVQPLVQFVQQSVVSNDHLL